MRQGPDWFAPKRYGYGAGLPISWQGWTIFIGFLAVVILAGIFLAERSIGAYLVLVLSLTAVFVWVTHRTTRGGWRWRWGEKE